MNRNDLSAILGILGLFACIVAVVFTIKQNYYMSSKIWCIATGLWAGASLIERSKED